EIAPLRRLDERSDYKLVQLVGAGGGPVDAPAMRYSAMVTMEGMARIAEYADAVSADIRLLLEEDGTPSGLVTAAHAAGLKVHAWTLRKENAFLPPPLRSGDDEGARGCPEKLWTLLARAGVDGIIADDPAVAVAARAGATCEQPEWRQRARAGGRIRIYGRAFPCLGPRLWRSAASMQKLEPRAREG